jgi:hypothetical protein
MATGTGAESSESSGGATGGELAYPLPGGQPLSWLGGALGLLVEVETASVGGGGIWDTATWEPGGDGIWGADGGFAFESITEYVEAVTTRGGQERFDARFSTASAVVTMDNTTGLFTPNAGANPWSAPFRPGRRVRISVIPDLDEPELTVPLFTGRIDSSNDEYSAQGANIRTNLNLIGAMGDLSAVNPLALVVATGVETTDERIESALDRASIDADLRQVQAGDHNMATSYLAQTVLEECQRAADAEGGAFFADGAGCYHFKSKDWLTTDLRSTVIQGYIGYGTPPGPPSAHIVGEPKTSWELARVRNAIHYSRSGGVLQTVSDGTSQGLYGERTYQRSDLNNNTDGEVLVLATRALAVYKDARVRIEKVNIAANYDPDNIALNPLFYETQFGDLLSVEISTLQGWSWTQEVHVIGITHKITADDWQVTLTLDDSLT